MNELVTLLPPPKAEKVVPDQIVQPYDFADVEPLLGCPGYEGVGEELEKPNWPPRKGWASRIKISLQLLHFYLRYPKANRAIEEYSRRSRK